MGTWGTGFDQNDSAGDALTFLTRGKRITFGSKRKTLRGADLLLHEMSSAIDRIAERRPDRDVACVVYAYGTVLLGALHPEVSVGHPGLLGARFFEIHDQLGTWFQELHGRLYNDLPLARSYAGLAHAALSVVINHEKANPADWNEKGQEQAWLSGLERVRAGLQQAYNARL